MNNNIILTIVRPKKVIIAEYIMLAALYVVETIKTAKLITKLLHAKSTIQPYKKPITNT
jgi:hypothetical protein